MIAVRFRKTGIMSLGPLMPMACLMALFPMSSVSGEDAAAAGCKLHLTPHSAPKLLEVVRPHEHEWRHLQVQWLTDVVAARKRAAAEDKPIIICYTGGAGYNEPLGVC